MPTGILIRNNNNELVLSSEAPVYGYVGQASLSTVVQASPPGPFRYAGYSEYVIYWPADIMVAVPLYGSPSLSTSILNKSYNPVNGIWTIRVQRGNGIDSSGFLIQQACPVYVWGLPYPGSSPNWGIQFINTSGSVVCDLSRRPLVIKGSVYFNSNAYTVNVPFSISSPGFLTGSSSFTATNVFSGGSWTITERSDTLYLESPTLVRTLVTTDIYTEDSPVSFTSVPSMPVQLVDLTGL
jgi:hypothetical protein